jgi:hypothetical protein
MEKIFEEAEWRNRFNEAIGRDTNFLTLVKELPGFSKTHRLIKGLHQVIMGVNGEINDYILPKRLKKEKIEKKLEEYANKYDDLVKEFGMPVSEKFVFDPIQNKWGEEFFEYLIDHIRIIRESRSELVKASFRKNLKRNLLEPKRE